MATRARRRPATAKSYFWFRGASVRALYDQIGAANPDSCLVAVRESAGKMTFTVVAEEADAKVRADPPINDSHKCPPQCP